MQYYYFRDSLQIENNQQNDASGQDLDYRIIQDIVTYKICSRRGNSFQRITYANKDKKRYNNPSLRLCLASGLVPTCQKREARLKITAKNGGISRTQA